jgi:diaphanous 1
MKGDKRSDMIALSFDRKKLLLKNNRQMKNNSSSPRQATQNPSSAVSYGSPNATNILPRLVPQLTGDAIMRRFSLTSWGSPTTAQPVVTSEGNKTSGEFSHGPMVSPQSKSRVQMTKVVEDVPPIQPQNTGGLWSSWWTSSGGDKSTDKKEAASLYISPLLGNKAPDHKLVKHLISLRVHLSTAKFAFIEDFVIREKGLEALAALLANLVGKKKVLSDVETTVLLEVIKCLRVLLNTEVSMSFQLVSFDKCLNSFYSPASKRFWRHPLSLLTYPILSTPLQSKFILSPRNC